MLQWTDIQSPQVALPNVNPTEALDTFSYRMERLGQQAREMDRRRAAMEQLASVMPMNSEPVGLANRTVSAIPFVEGQNGLSTARKESPMTTRSVSSKKAPIQAVEPYMDIFRNASQTHGVPLPVLLAVAQTESNFNPSAVSPTGVKGLMQVTQSTYNGLGMTGDRSDPANSVNAGAKLLSQLYKKYGNWDDAFYAYNGGHHGVTGIRQGKWGTWANNKAKQKEITDYAKKVNNFLSVWNELYG